MNQNEPVALSLGPTRWVARPLSKWEICKIAFKDKTFILMLITSIALVALGIYFWTLTTSSIMSYYEKYAEGTWSVQPYLNGIALPIRPLELGDIVDWGIELSFYNVFFDLLCLFAIYKTIKVLQERLSSEPDRLVAVSEVVRTPISPAPSGRQVRDCFSGTPLSLAEERPLQALTVGQHTSNLWSMINRVLSKEAPHSHPVEERPMTSEERRKFDEDVKIRPGITDLDTVWSADPEDRKRRFLSLLPQSTIDRHNLSAIFADQEITATAG